jgi:hypothetical protein
MAFISREFNIRYLPQQLDRKLPPTGFPGAVNADASEATIRLAHELHVEQKNGDLYISTHPKCHIPNMKNVYAGMNACTKRR